MLEYMLECVAYFYDIRVLISLIAIYLLYKFGHSQHNLHLKLGHRGPPPLPYLGNFIDIIRYGIHELDKECLKKYGRIYPFYFGNIKVCVVSDGVLLKQILIKEAKCFTDRLNIGFRSKSNKKMLTVLKGKEWERVRNLVTPTFTSGKLRKMSPLIADGVNLLEKRIAKHSPDKPIDFKEFYGALTMDVIARTMFGMHIDSQTNPNNLFIINAKKLFSISRFNPLFALFVIFPKFAKFIFKAFPNYEIFGRDTMQFFNSNLGKAIDEREQTAEQYSDFLALMLQAHKEIDENDSDQSKTVESKSLTREEIMAQAFIFLLAGYETTSTTLTFVTYFLAKNPTAQQEVYDEILDKIGIEGEITYETLMTMPLLDAAISETLRICPPVPRLNRTCTQDIILVTSDNRQINARKGDVFAVPVYAIHTDPSIWPDPDKYDLHRFDPEIKKNHSPYSFMPFGMGPRNCVGMRFALLEVKWALVNVLRKFEIVPCAETLDKMKFRNSGLTSPVIPILLKVIKRDYVFNKWNPKADFH